MKFSSSNQKLLDKIDYHMKQGEYELAIRKAQDYLDKHPESYLMWCLLGWAYLNTGQLIKAEGCFTQSIGLNPDWDNGYVGMGVLNRKRGDLDKAIQNYETAISLEPSNAEAFSRLMVIELMRGNYKKAVDYGEKAWRLRKDLPSIAANLSIAYHYWGDNYKREEFYKIAEQMGYPNLKEMNDLFAGKISISKSIDRTRSIK